MATQVKAHYPELRFPIRKAPTFPATCPACGAAQVSEYTMGNTYECGGGYRPKDQCQNHTDVYWGKCPAVKEA